MTFEPEDYIPNSVRLLNNACDTQYIRRGDSISLIKLFPICPENRCWYEEQVARRDAGKLAVHPEAWEKEWLSLS